MNSLLLLVVKAHSKAQGVLSLVPVPKIYKLYAMLNGSTVYFSLDCTFRYHCITPLPEAEKKSVFVTPVGKSDFKKIQFGSISHTLSMGNK